MKTRKSGKQTNKQTVSSLKLKYSDSFLCRIPERTPEIQIEKDREQDRN